jgi:hypothetical protein
MAADYPSSPDELKNLVQLFRDELRQRATTGLLGPLLQHLVRGSLFRLPT